MNRLTKLVALCLTGILMACASSPNQISYYQLTKSVQTVNSSASNIVIKVELAPLLDRVNLVFQSAPNQIYFAKQHLWAEDLATAIGKTLVNELNGLDQTTNYSLQEVSQPVASIKVFVDAFHSINNGQVLIAGITAITSSKGVSRRDNFHIHRQQTASGYAAMVASLDAGLAELANQIVNNKNNLTLD